MDVETNILIVEDNKSIIEGLQYILTKEGFNVTIANTKNEALNYMVNNKYNLFLIDVQLPDGTGYELCKYIKLNYDLPVILGSAVGEEANVVYGLDLGADDFIVKPYRNNELIARINCVLRREARNRNKNIMVYRNIKIDLQNAHVINISLNQEIMLTNIEYKLLLLLLKNKNRLVTRSEILDKVWDFDGNFVNDNTLSVYIKRLRDKIGNNTSEELIQTVRGIGYILNE
jgi:DNA-binding response OmpR family regulator